MASKRLTYRDQYNNLVCHALTRSLATGISKATEFLPFHSRIRHKCFRNHLAVKQVPPRFDKTDGKVAHSRCTAEQHSQCSHDRDR